MMTSGVTILVMIPVLTMNTSAKKVMSLTDAAFTARGPHTVCTALTATTADEAASAHIHNR